MGNFENEIRIMQCELDEFLKSKFEGNRIHLKPMKLDNNEKPSKYFIKKEKDNSNWKLIMKLKTENGEVTNFEEIKKEICSFYTKLYNYEEINESIADEFLQDNKIIWYR